MDTRMQHSEPPKLVSCGSSYWRQKEKREKNIMLFTFLLVMIKLSDYGQCLVGGWGTSRQRLVNAN
jgi:hypothetical protein